MIRPARPDELGFVIKPWIRSYAASDQALLVTPKDDRHTVKCPTCGHRAMRITLDGGKAIAHAGKRYWEGQQRLIERLCATANVSVSEGDDGLKDGFVVRDRERPIVHYVYVTPIARKRGIAHELLADLVEAPTISTHMLHNRLPAGWTYDFYALVNP